MDVSKCIVPVRQGVALNVRRAESPLMWLVEGKDRWQALLPTIWVFSLKIVVERSTVTCMMFKATANDRPDFFSNMEAMMELRASWTSMDRTPTGCKQHRNTNGFHLADFFSNMEAMMELRASWTSMDRTPQDANSTGIRMAFSEITTLQTILFLYHQDVDSRS
ncbi:hypothetical protein TNCV_2610421 [Trichonephila clavipes]|nr:hypothetical protein TNCV_2610421 [Trichonephila clavipes]